MQQDLPRHVPVQRGVKGLPRHYHDTPFEVPVGRVAKPMPTSKQALAEAYCAIGHVVAAVSTVKNKYSKEVLINKVWAAQCTECDYEQKEAEYDDADDGARSDAVSMPSLWRRTPARTATAATG